MFTAFNVKTTACLTTANTVKSTSYYNASPTFNNETTAYNERCDAYILEFEHDIIILTPYRIKEDCFF